MSDHPANLFVIGSEAEFEEKLKSPGLVVADFFAPWCGPCKRLIQLLPGIAEANPEVTFIKINVEEQQGLAGKYDVQSIPHIRFFKDGESKHLIVGADINGIKAKIAELK